MTRPIYHKCDETIRGHVVCSFLALLLKGTLEQRLEEKGHTWEWAEIVTLDALHIAIKTRGASGMALRRLKAIGCH